MRRSKEDWIKEWISWIAGIVVVTILGVAVSLALGNVTHGEYVAVRAILFAAAAALIGCYRIWLSKRRSAREKIRGALIALAAAAIPFSLGFWWVPFRETYSLLQITQYPPLVPDDRPDPEAPTVLCPNTLNIVFGGSVFGGVDFPFAAVQFKGRPVILIERGENGLLFTFDVIDSEGKILARVVKNAVTISQRALMPQRTSLHSLLINDDTGREVLNIDYLNPHTLTIKGRFYIEKGYLVAIFKAPWGTQIDAGTTTFRAETRCGVGRVGFNLPPSP